MRFFVMLLLCLGSVIAQDYDPSKEVKSVLTVRHESVEYMPTRGYEWRSFWVDAWNKGIFNVDQVKQVVDIAKKYGYNAIVVQVRRRGDAIYFPTYPNIEPRISGLAADFDVLQEMITRAHAARIEVHAWITTFLVSTSHPSSSAQHVYNKHNEFLSQNSQGNKKIGEGYYLDPGHPGALAWNTNVVMDIVRHYDIDGLHFDYVRYPQQDAGFNPVAIARYNREFNTSGQPAANDARFAQWRRRQITDWLRKMYANITEVKPQMKVSAATFAARSDAYHHRFQDWAQWMSEGIIDANFPMNYSTSSNIYQERVRDALSHSYGRHVYMGIGAYLIPQQNVISQLQYARNQGASGLILFSYANNNKGGNWLDCYNSIHQQVFTSTGVVPPMPWKKNYGHVRGLVTGVDGKAIYNADITSLELRQTVKTDAVGEFALLGLTNGVHTLVCRKLGYKEQQISVNIHNGMVSKANFVLTPGTLSQIVIDNQNASFTGNWTIASSANEKYGSDYRYIGRGTGKNSVVYTLNPAIQGRYRLYVWYSSGQNRTSDASYKILHNDGVSTVKVNQQQNGGRWALLGTWNFDGQKQHSVSLSDAFFNGQVAIADAIKLESE